jgi:hypothetical protein
MSSRLLTKAVVARDYEDEDLRQEENRALLIPNPQVG